MIELMITVVVLSSGLVLILQSLNSTMLGFNHVQNQYFAAKISREKLEELEERVLREKAIDEREKEEIVTHQGRVFSVKIEMTPHMLDTAAFPQILPESKDFFAYPQISEALYKVEVRVNWKERNFSKQSTLTAYISAKEAVQ